MAKDTSTELNVDGFLANGCQKVPQPEPDTKVEAAVAEAHRAPDHPEVAHPAVPNHRCPKARLAVAEAVANNTAKPLPATNRWLPRRQRRFVVLAIKDHRGRLDPKESRAKMERMETMERTGTTEKMPKHCLRHQRSHALSAPLDHLDLKVPPVQRDHQGQKVLPVSLHVMECPANRECKDNRDQSVALAAKGPEAHPANPVALFQFQAHKALLAHPVHPENKAPRDSLDRMVNHSKVLQAHRAILANRDVKDVPEDQVPPVHLAKMARREPATIVQNQELHQVTLPKLAAVEEAVEPVPIIDENAMFWTFWEKADYL